MRKEGEISKTIIFFASTLSFIFGITLISFIPVLTQVSEFFYFGIFLFFAVLLVFVKNRKIKIAILIVIFLFLGLWRYSFSIYRPKENDLAYFNEQKVKIKGVVQSDVIFKHRKQKFTIESDEIKTANLWKKTKGKLLVYAKAYPTIQYGDKLLLDCELKIPEAFQDFAYDRYLSRHNIYSICYDSQFKKIAFNQGNYFFKISFYLKNKIRDIIDRGLGEPEASLARAIILGDGKNIDNNLRINFSRAGISHIIAISGLHIGIIAGMIAWFLFEIGFSRSQIFYVVSASLSLFIVLVGAPASAVRAGLMVVLAMYAVKIGRTSQIERLIILVACLLLFINPKLLRDDIGFQLSFTAVFGIIYLFPIIKIFLEKIKVTSKYKIRDILGVTLAAQIATGPIAAFYFGILPILGIVANLLVLWTLPFLIGSILVAIILGFIFGNFLVYIFFIPMIILDYIILVPKLINKIPLAYIEVKKNIIFLLLYYLVLIVFLFWSKGRQKSMREKIRTIKNKERR